MVVRPLALVRFTPDLPLAVGGGHILGDDVTGVAMKTHRLPFENRWTNSEQAWHWNCELERLGVATVRIMFADHEVHDPGGRAAVLDIPAGFVRDWLAFHDRRAARQQLFWRAAVIALLLIAACAAVVGLFNA